MVYEVRILRRNIFTVGFVVDGRWYPSGEFACLPAARVERDRLNRAVNARKGSRSKRDLGVFK